MNERALNDEKLAKLNKNLSCTCLVKLEEWRTLEIESFSFTFFIKKKKEKLLM